MRRLLVVAALLILFAAACGEAAPVDATNPPPAEVTSVDEAGPLRSCFPFNPTFADPYSVPGRFAVIGTWMETPASSLATSNGVEAVVFDEQDYLRFADLPALLQQSTVLWSKPDFELDTLHMKPEAAPAIDSLSDEIVFVGVSNFWTGGPVHMFLWEADDGTVAVAGTCVDTEDVSSFVAAYIEDQGAESVTDELRAMVSDPDIADKLYDWPPEDPPLAWEDRDPFERQLLTAPNRITNPLTVVDLRITVPLEWREGFEACEEGGCQTRHYSLCNRTDLAWHECISMHPDAGPITLDILAYMDDDVDREIEFWVLNDSVDGANPLLFLGAVAYTPGMKRLDVDISSVPGKSLADLIAAGDDLDIVTAAERG